MDKMSKRKRQAIKTKNRLMECAIKLFQEKGFYNVTVDEITEHANSSKGGFYNHFSSKEELLFNMTALIDKEYEEYTKRIIEADNTIDELLFFIIFIFNTMEEKIGLDFLSVIYSSQIKDTNFPKFHINPERNYYQLLETMINKGKSKNEINANITTPQVIKLITTTIRGVVYEWCLSRGEYSLSKNGKEMIIIVLQGIRK
ncbi:TetR/AcrR family transcriptional regulator [Virgibacillus doumboii]|uniref:TetR/AcrR family transcriptional regulator n=1 Tax=Virgibacillus doumboii TaxID=2697503 RepID=UPI0013DED6D0|nr:TetR/AcrR family transcriptional regulator [Virgibacillus doumboii]